MVTVLGIAAGYVLGIWAERCKAAHRSAHAEEMAKHATHGPAKPRRCTGCQCLVKSGKDDNHCRWPCSWFGFYTLFGGRVCSRRRWIARGLSGQNRHYFNKDRQ